MQNQGRSVGKAKDPTHLQLRMLQMLVDGMTQKEIALKLGRNHRTVRLHFQRLKHKMNAVSLFQVVAFSTARGWIIAPPTKHEIKAGTPRPL